MWYLISLCIALTGMSAAFCQVTGLEYFIDTDPGYSNAASLPVTAGNDVSATFNIALANVGEGHHILNLRARDAQGRWSVTTARSFYVLSGKAATVTGTEYFIDTDPGYGNASTISGAVGNDGSLKFVVPLSNVSTGFHVLYVRSKDDLGRWSSVQQHMF